MRKAKTLAIPLSVVFLLTVTASLARADAIFAGDLVVKFNNLESLHLNLPDQHRAAAGTILHFTELFENNNGKHLGFTVASTNPGLKFGLFRPPQTSGSGGTIPNPEPAAVFLLGTGLAAVGAYARKRFRKSDQ